jgi:hypothetical protein
VHGVLGVNRGVALIDMVVDVRDKELAFVRIIQFGDDIVVAGLHTNHRLGRQAAERPRERARGPSSAIDSIVVLMELVAVDRIVCVPGVVVPQVHRVLDQIGVGLPRAVVRRLRHPPGEREAAGVAAVSRIEFAIEADLPGRIGA